MAVEGLPPASASWNARNARLERLRPLTAVWLFAVTLFLGSFLMFLMEPMIAKMVLPLMGGAPMVWNTCVVFFQMTLLGGYACAHSAARLLGPQRYALAHAALLILPYAALPIALPDSMTSSVTSPLVSLLLTLVVAIGLPFFALAASASGLQTWYAATDHPGAHDPYFLYAASNLGSLLALLLYPTLVEPMLSLGNQSRLWTIGYLAFMLLALACAVLTWRGARPSVDASTTASREPGVRATTWRQRLNWVVLSLVPSSLLLGVTTYISTDLASIPLLWIVPLSIYLLTFAVAFGARSNLWGATADDTMPLLVAALAVFLTPVAGLSVWFAVVLHLSVFTAAAMACHGRLAAERPAPSLLTEFYFWVALGGLLGGVFNTLVAPMLFDSVIEYPLMILCASVVASPIRTWWRNLRVFDGLAPLATFGLSVLILLAFDRFGVGGYLLVAALALLAVIAFSQSARRVRFALMIASLLIAASLTTGAYGRVLHHERTFFGVYRVSMDESGQLISLVHGTTLHGRQARGSARQKEPLTYYHTTGPFGQAFEGLTRLSKTSAVAVVGLGVGSLASYAHDGQTWTFYEIDPAVDRIARNEEYFTFLKDCGDRCRVVLGDARLELARAKPNQFGLIVLDAFSSDAIPIHLMTREALSLYLTKLTPDGVLAFHISNRHLRLAPVLARLAESHGLAALRQFHAVTQEEAAAGQSESEWMLMARDEQYLEPLIADSRWRKPDVPPSTPLWSDDFSNVLSVLE